MKLSVRRFWSLAVGIDTGADDYPLKRSHSQLKLDWNVLKLAALPSAMKA
ncbi:MULTISPECIES: hypothetical protein [Hyphomicrobiales]|jgi:hypothetical protein|uniref:Uncharacterized protein n=1 Tax=Aquamicrobium ahrensii TaxID=469551 RepID=A0ABV2KSN8_9HYPH|nr:hypothetical protein [Ochrobactrum sp. A-1]